MPFSNVPNSPGDRQQKNKSPQKKGPATGTLFTRQRGTAAITGRREATQPGADQEGHQHVRDLGSTVVSSAVRSLSVEYGARNWKDPMFFHQKGFCSWAPSNVVHIPVKARRARRKAAAEEEEEEEEEDQA